MTEEVTVRLRRDSDSSALSNWLASRRWFADKGRGIAGVEIVDVLAAPIGAATLTLAIVDVRFVDGEHARYFLTNAYFDRHFVEAAEVDGFGTWLLDQFGPAEDTSKPVWRFAASPDAGQLLARAREFPATLMRAEQSNTSLRYDDAVIIKLIRRLQSGPNPEAEMLGALSVGGFSNVPRFIGEGSWRSASGETYPLALAQAFVPNDGDGWSWLLRQLDSIVAGIADHATELPALRTLGRRTGELHVALHQVPSPDFAPEPASDASIAAEVARIEHAAQEAIAVLLATAAATNALSSPSLTGVPGQVRAAAARAAGLREEIGLPRIRVHGDYHLGQTLRTLDDDWMIIDFEGEPARSVAERRQKTSPLKDVAGMLRSFAYARGAAERSLTNVDAHSLQRLAQWEGAAREAFVGAYRTAVRAAPAPLVPADDLAFSRALAAWELDKALYEIAYEARNRPDWLDLPLRAFQPEPIP